MGVKMIEPICWIRQDGVISFHKQKEIDSQYFKWHPLYLHPIRELTDEEYEKIMKQWDYWRKQIANGDTSSAPRDWFESTIDYLLEKVSEK